MQAGGLEVDARESLGKVLDEMQARGVPMLGVTSSGKLVGIVNQDNLMELLRIHAAVESSVH